MAVTDKERSEMFKQLLKDTMKNHETELSLISEFCDNFENETKAMINTNVDFKQLAVVVTTKEFNEILKESTKTYPGPDKICYKLLKELPKNVNPLPVTSYLAPLITRMFQLTEKNPRLKWYQSKTKTKQRPKTTDTLVLQIV